MDEDPRMSASCGNGHEAAAYVLGALEPAEAEAFRRHLRSCGVCKDEVESLQPVVDALPMAVPQYEVPADLRAHVMDAVHAEPKSPSAAMGPAPRAFTRRLPRPVLAAVSAVVLATAVVLGLELGGGDGGSRVIRAQVGGAQLRISGSRGEMIVRHLPAPRPGRIYELWIQYGTRAPVPSTLFSVTSNGSADVGVPGTMRGISHVMVTSEPAGGSRAPTTAPVIVISAA